MDGFTHFNNNKSIGRLEYPLILIQSQATFGIPANLIYTVILLNFQSLPGIVFVLQYAYFILNIQYFLFILGPCSFAIEKLFGLSFFEKN